MHRLSMPKRPSAALLPIMLAPLAPWFAMSPLRDAPEPTPQALPPVAARADAAALLRRFALNALLAPLLDADAPPLRWADPALISGCGAGSAVRVDGVPLVVGAPMPTDTFTLNWVMVDCMPFGNASMAVSGSVTLRVVPDEHGTRATVHAEHLRVDGVPVGAALAQPFTAFLAHAPAGADTL